MKIVFLDTKAIGENIDFSRFNLLGNFVEYAETSTQNILPRIQGAEIIITSKVKLTKSILSICKNLKLICVAATGVDNIDIKSAKELGIQISNVPEYSTKSVAQITFSHILRLASNLAKFEEHILSGNYSNSSVPSCLDYSFEELTNKIIGIVGLGKIGSKIAELAEAFHMKVICHSTTNKNNSSKYLKVSLDELLNISDIISIHCPLNIETKNLFSKKDFLKMKKNAIIINMARGGIIHENDLLNALENNIIAGAALDVFDKEPLLYESKLIKFAQKSPNLILTPHIGWASTQSKNDLINGVFKNIEAYLKR